MKFSNFTDKISLNDVLTIDKHHTQILPNSDQPINYTVIGIGALISTSIVIGGIFFNNRPWIKLIERSTYVNAETKTIHNEYRFSIFWGWKFFPWHYIPKLRKLEAITVNDDTEIELYYYPRNDDPEILPHDCTNKKSIEGKLTISFKDRKYFISNAITEVHLITKDRENSDNGFTVTPEFFPDDVNIEMIQFTNSGKYPVQNYVFTLTEAQTNALISKRPNYETYLRMKNSGKISQCFIKNKQLCLIITQIPASQKGIDGAISINLV